MLTSLVQAQGFDLATATKWTSELLGDFCDAADFDLGFVPDASLLMPPEQNYFVADEPRSNEELLLGDTERGSEVTAALSPPLAPFRPLFRRAHPPVRPA